MYIAFGAAWTRAAGNAVDDVVADPLREQCVHRIRPFPIRGQPSKAHTIGTCRRRAHSSERPHHGMWDATPELFMKHSQDIRNRIVGINIPPTERVITGLAAAGLAAFGISRRSLPGLLLAGAGVAAMARAAIGRCPMYRARAIRKGIHVHRVVTIQCTPREVYDLWRDLTNLPKFMHHVKSVTMEADGISKWVVTEGPRELEWRAKIVEDTPGRRLRWASLPGGDIEHSGALELREAPADRGTEVEVKMHYLPPGGLIVASALYGFLRRLARVQIGMELVRLRQLIETGEIATGARRIADIEKEDKGALESDRLRPQMSAPVTTAQRSAWPTTGGAR